MKNNLFKPSIRTDLALETGELLSQSGQGIKGVEITTDETEGITATWVKIVDSDGAEAMGKPVGNYITIESEAMKGNDADSHESIIKVMSEYVNKMIYVDKLESILVAGLGNWNVTPDALGPKAVEKILVTRHLSEHMPEALLGTLRPVSAISPGVMGITGIETGDIIKGIVGSAKPDLVVAIDALAARHIRRVNTTIQITDTGINPGAGLGNRRMRLSRETLGVPVVAIGVPTVVDAATLVNDTLGLILNEMSAAAGESAAFYQMLTEMESAEKYALFTEILNNENMFVTPKEIDAVINRLADIIANALNIALHPGITKEDIHRYTY
jgi:spore protease